MQVPIFHRDGGFCPVGWGGFIYRRNAPKDSKHELLQYLLLWCKQVGAYDLFYEHIFQKGHILAALFDLFLELDFL